MITMHVLTVPGADPVRDELVARMQDDHESVCLHTDPLRKGVLANFASALDCAGRMGSRTAGSQGWSLIVQDDAVLIPGWKDELAEALHYSPCAILGLTYFGSYGVRLAERGVPYGVAKNAVWGGAVAYRQTVLTPLLELVDFAISIGWNKHGDDGSVCAFNHIRGGDSALAARAIFGQAPVKSLLGHSNRAQCFPRLTIADRGPAWRAWPRSIRLSTRAKPPDVMELVEAWRTR